MKKMRVVILVFVLLLGSRNAKAESSKFHSSDILVKSVAINEYVARITSSTPLTPLCPNGPTNDAWAFISKKDFDARANIKALVKAKLDKTTASIVTVVEVVEGETYCHILTVNF